MPTKEFKYRVTIQNRVENSGVKSGTEELEKQLSKTEKRALKMIETVKSAFKSLEQSGINTSKVEAAQSRIIVADEKALRAIRSSEQQKILLTEKTRQAQIKTADMSARAAERSAEAQIRSARAVGREEDRIYESRAKFELNQRLRQERFDQARFRSAQMYAREIERQQNAEARRTATIQRNRDRISNRKMSEAADIDAGIGTVAQTAAIGAAAVVAGGIYAIVKAGSEYEKSQNMFQAVTRASAAEMAAASKKAKELGADVSQESNEIRTVDKVWCE